MDNGFQYKTYIFTFHFYSCQRCNSLILPSKLVFDCRCLNCIGILFNGFFGFGANHLSAMTIICWFKISKRMDHTMNILSLFWYQSLLEWCGLILWMRNSEKERQLLWSLWRLLNVMCHVKCHVLWCVEISFHLPRKKKYGNLTRLRKVAVWGVPTSTRSWWRWWGSSFNWLDDKA